jgi:hypothetical protein
MSLVKDEITFINITTNVGELAITMSLAVNHLTYVSVTVLPHFFSFYWQNARPLFPAEIKVGSLSSLGLGKITLEEGMAFVRIHSSSGDIIVGPN